MSSVFNNPLTQSQTVNTNATQIGQMISQIKSASNPMAMFNSLMQSNPKLSQTVNDINTNYGGDAKAAFFDKAKQMGVDPNQIISALNGMSGM